MHSYWSCSCHLTLHEQWLKEKAWLGDRVETLQFQGDPKSLGCKQQNSTHKSYINTKGKGEDEAKSGKGDE